MRLEIIYSLQVQLLFRNCNVCCHSVTEVLWSGLRPEDFPSFTVMNLSHIRVAIHATRPAASPINKSVAIVVTDVIAHNDAALVSCRKRWEKCLRFKSRIPVSIKMEAKTVKGIAAISHGNALTKTATHNPCRIVV